MRLSPHLGPAKVDLVEDAAKLPVRMRFGTITIRMEVDEAIDLANQLVDNAETVRTQERNQP